MLEAVSREEFEAWREPRVGGENPTRMDNPLWAALVHERINAYQVAKRFGRERQLGDKATWCFDRFGRSTTVLPDRRTVHIAGEHEDYYDADFHIYNDVVVVERDGRVTIYGYPYAAFPSTDFHSATLIGEQIWVVGSLGYGHLRQYGTTPVCRLDLATMAMERVATTGEMPGWIHKHEAVLEDGAIVIRGGLIDRGTEDRTLFENIDTWSLDVESLVWTRRTRLDWQRWTVRRGDGKRNALYQLRNWLGEIDREDSMWVAKYRADVIRELGQAPDLDLLRGLYAYGGARSLPSREDELRVFRVELDGVVVRFTETSDAIAVMVEGRLTDDRLAGLQRHLVERLDALESTDAWIIAP